MKLRVRFTEEVTYESEIRLTAAQVAEALAAARLDEDADVEDQHDAVVAWLKGETGVTDDQGDREARWFGLFEDQRPGWPTGAGVAITIHERDLTAIAVTDREGL